MLTGRGYGLTWAKTFDYACGNLVPGAIEADGPMGGLIDAADLDVTWTLSAAGGKDRMRYTSTNPLYVTGKDPAAEVYHTVLDIGCTGAKGERPRNPGEAEPVAGQRDGEVLDGVWAKFAAPALSVPRTSDGAEMKYWGPISSINYSDQQRDEENYTMGGLLKHADGRCGSWAALFVAVLDQQGIAAVSGTIEVIKPVPLVPFPGPAQHDFSDMKIAAIPAQGGMPSKNTFTNHELVRCNGRIYDPSYGRDFANLAEWEDSSVTHIISVYKRPDNTQIVREAPQLPGEPELDFV